MRLHQKENTSTCIFHMDLLCLRASISSGLKLYVRNDEDANKKHKLTST